MKKDTIITLIIIPIIFFYVYYPNKQIKQPKTSTSISIESNFTELLGETTPYWSFLNSALDMKFLNECKQLYLKRKSLQFVNLTSFKIPKIIHVIWLGPKSFPLESIKHMRQWCAHHPDWTIKFWTDRERPPPCKNMQVHLVQDFGFKSLKEEYAVSDNWGEKSDILRYEILYQQGGIYIDHDASCKKSFHRLNQGYDFFACLEVPHEGVDNMQLTVGIGIIGARPHHPILKQTIRHVKNRWASVTERFKYSDPYTSAVRVSHRTYIALTYAIKDKVDQYNNKDIIFPASYFYPRGELPGIYSEHLYGTSWNSLKEKSYTKNLSKALCDTRKIERKIIKLGILTLVSIGGIFVLLFKIKKKLSHL